MSTNITSAVASWAGQSPMDQTLGIRASDETDPYGWKRFWSANNSGSTIPYISYTINHAPGGSDAPGLSPAAPVHPARRVLSLVHRLDDAVDLDPRQRPGQ